MRGVEDSVQVGVAHVQEQFFFVRGPLSGVRLVHGCAFPSSGPQPCSMNACMRSKCRGFTSSWQTASDIAQMQTPGVRKTGDLLPEKLDELPIFSKNPNA